MEEQLHPQHQQNLHAGSTKNSSKEPNFWKDMLKSAALAFIIVVLIRSFIAQPFKVAGQSMDPTFIEEEYMIIDQISYKITPPKRGDVIVFRYPNDPKVFYIKRIIAVPGESVTIDQGTVTISQANGDTEVLTEPYVANHDTRSMPTLDVTEGHYFVMGDNRPVSSDSRMWGLLPQENIVGRPFLSILPLARAAIYPGEYISK